MEEFRPYQVSAQPIFLIAFTVLAVVYSGWTGYAYFFLDAVVSWYSIVFIGAVLLFLWYNRLSRSFYVRLNDDSIEWLMKRNSHETLQVANIELVSEHRMSLDFLIDATWKEIPLTDFEKSGKRAEFLEAVKRWCSQNNIEFKETE